MRIRNKILCIALTCCMLMTVFMPIGTIKLNAAGEQQYVAQVGSTRYENYKDAWSAIQKGGTLTMLADWHITEMLTVAENAQITVNMNGHMINRGLAESEDSGGVFFVAKNGSLILNGNDVNSTEHWGTVRNGKWNYQENGLGTVKINGSLLTGGYNDDGGGAIDIQENAEVRLDGVTVAGNACSESDEGGAVRLTENNGKLYLTNSTVSYNRADDGGGSAIWVDGVGCYVEIVNTEIHHNLSCVDYGDGGAIQINDGSVEIKNSVLSFNEAGRNGGAIYVYNGNLVVDKDTVISYNIANQDGGAIYANSKADAVKIAGRYIGNRAKEEGGAIYVNSSVSGDSGVKISNAEMLGNIASENGGAVYVDVDNTVSLSGQVVMQGNSPDNLHIRAAQAIAKNNLSDGSLIGVFAPWEENQGYVQTDNHQYFFSDKVGYDIESRSGNLYFAKSEKGAPSSYKVGDTEYELVKNTFYYTSAESEEIKSYFYYSDGYFAENPKYYNEHFSSFAASLALAAMPKMYEGEYVEEKSAKYIVDMFTAMGYSDIYVHYPKPQYFGEDAENLSTIGYAIAKKNIVVNGAEVTVIATAVRGAEYYAEWASNVTLGTGFGEAKGFGDAARQVREGIDAYIAKNGINTKSAKFLITGYSRAAATSNLVAKKLTDNYGEDCVYAYCFEAPKGGVFSELKKGLSYTNIHNVINNVDIVTTVGTEEMGFIRYGVDHIIPSYKVGTDAYNAQKELMLAQLSSINKNIEHNDKFSEATIEYIASTIDFTGAIFDLIDPEWFPDYENAEEWVPHFIEKLQEYSMNDMTDKSNPNGNDNAFNNKSDSWYGYRNFYSNYKWYIYFDEADGNKIKIKSYATEPADFDSGKYIPLSVEDAAGNLVLFYFDSTPEKKEAILEVFSSLDMESLMENIDVYHIWTVVIDNWHELTVDEKNKEFNDLWQVINSSAKDDSGLTLEEKLKRVLTDEEYETIMSSIFVMADFLLDFVAEDYYYSDQNLVGTLIYNVGNIMQTHYHDVAYSWVRSYDSFYSDVEYVCNHSYGDWSIVKEATAEEDGVQTKTCSRCGEIVYEAIPKLAEEKPLTSVPNATEKDSSKTSFFKTIAVIAIVVCVVLWVAAGVVIFIAIKKKKKVVTPKSE